MNDIAKTRRAPRPFADPAQKDFDVLIVGAGISGIGAAHHLVANCPEKSFVMLDAKETHGGTWRQHTYPGIRSDSDLYTFGYRFKPWGGSPIAPAGDILQYLEEAIEDDDLAPHIRYGRKVARAGWSSALKRWEVDVEDKATGETERYSAAFLWMCQGYYDHENPYTPDWEGMSDFKGRIVHPQKWPEDLDYKDKRVIVIGSGATAATLIPSMTEDVSHITMLQRSPTYFHPGVNQNELADKLRSLEIPEEWTHEIVRRAYLKEAREIHQVASEHPDLMKAEMIKVVRDYLGPDFDVETHFTPSYKPWQQRIAFVPDGDLFEAVKTGKVSIVTDHIDRFTEKGVLLKSGAELEADVIITATGFNLSFLGDIPFEVDGEKVDFADRVAYRGVMISGVPNMSYIFGYLRTAWTMRVDLLGDFVTRLFNHMKDKGVSVVRPELAAEEASMPRDRLIPEDEFNSGYLARGIHKFPKRIDKDAWRPITNYYVEKDALPAIDLDESALKYS